jgi:hypothetical protein
MAAQSYVNFTQPGSNQPTCYVVADGFVGPPTTWNLNSPTFTSASFPSGASFPGTGTFNNVTFNPSQSAVGDGFYNAAAGHQVNVSINASSVGAFTSTGANSLAIGATTPSTGAFTTLSCKPTIAINGATSGAITLAVPATAGTFTATFPSATGTVAISPNTTLFQPDIYVSTSAQTANTNVILANIPGLAATVVIGTYKFRVVLPSTVASGTGGINYAFNYTNSAALSSLEATGMGYTASAVAVQHTTTTTTQTSLFTQAAVVLMTIIEGVMVVSAGGTVSVQMCQNTSNGSNSVTLINSSFTLTRIA